MKEKESGEEREEEEEEEERELANERVRRERKGSREKKCVRVEANLGRSVCCRPARLDRHLHMGEAGGKTGAGTWASRSEIQRKQMNSRMQGV